MPSSVCRWFHLFIVRCVAMVGVLGCLMAGVLSKAETGPADYLIDVKDTEDDLPSSTVTAIVQTPDGYLWVGTYSGLSRFDGERFVTYTPVSTLELSHARIQGLYVDARGTLWINTFRGGLTSYRDGVFHREWEDDPTWFDLHTTLASSSSNEVVFVTQFGEVLRRDISDPESRWKVSIPPGGARPIYQCAGQDGALWFLTREGHIVTFQAGRFEELPEAGGLRQRHVYTLVADSKGTVWAGATNEIARWTGSHFEDMTPTNGTANLEPVMLFSTRAGALWVLAGERLRKQVGRRWVAEAAEWQGLLGWAANRAMGVHEDQSGGVWFNHYGNGVFHITPDGDYQRLTTKDGLPGDRVNAWYQSRDGGLWLGVDRGGLVRLRKRRFHVIDMAEGLLARAALSVCEDRDGTVWIGTSGGGLCRWSGDKISAFPVGNNASANFVFSLYPRHDGGIWLSAAEGEDLYLFRDGQIQRAPWDVHGVKSIVEDADGRLWLGTKAGLAWYSDSSRRLFGTNDGLALSAVRALAKAPDGTIWSGGDDGTLYRCEPDRLDAFRAHDALARQPIWSLLADQEGAVWAGTFRGGLLRFKGGKFSRFTSKQGLPVEVISQILEDNHGRLWLGTHQGICCVSKSALNDCADGVAARVDCVTYGRMDGLPTLECSDGYQPACWRGADGRLWFTTVKGVVYVNPDELTDNAPPPPVLIEELSVDGEIQPLKSGRVVIPPGHNQFDFRYTALSFDATRFRYRLDGLDTDWVDAGTRRTVEYSHLPAHDYRFRVIACDDKGIWPTQGAAIAFQVEPYLYQTWWFITLASLSVIGSVALIVRSTAARKYQRELARLEQQHAIERDRARIAKDIHDDVGAGLTQITLLSELARREQENAGLHLDRISDSARQLTRAMDEIVWAVDPQHDTFNGLMDYISAFAEDFLRMAGIRCRMDLPTTLPEMRVEAELRYNLFLAVKEALNNVVKHAQATEVWLRLKIGPGLFTLAIEDNGKGFPGNGTRGTAASVGDRISSGSGLLNLEKRLTTIGGRCSVHSAPGKGTRVEMTISLPMSASPVVAIGQKLRTR